MRLALMLALVGLSLPVVVQAAAPPTPGTGVVPSEPSTPQIREFLGQLSLLSRTQLVGLLPHSTQERSCSCCGYPTTDGGEIYNWMPALNEDGSYDTKQRPLTRFEHAEEHLASLGGMEFKHDSEETEGFLAKEYRSLNPQLYGDLYSTKKFDDNQIFNFHFGSHR